MFFTKARRELARRFAVTSRDDHPSMPLQARLMAPARATTVAEVRLLKDFRSATSRSLWHTTPSGDGQSRDNTLRRMPS
jgi:hypothetical protein